MLKIFTLLVVSFFLGSSVFSLGWLIVLSLGLALASGAHAMSWFVLSGEFGWDSMGWSMSVLSLWVCMITLHVSVGVNNSAFFNMCLVSLSFILVITFSVHSLIVFYIFFEFSLIPTLFLILGWGYQSERLSASFYFILYTVFASLPLLYILSGLESGSSTPLEASILKPSLEGWAFLYCCSAAFLVKLPIYGAHLWLIKAHVEAPVVGSMFLASVMLKLGGVGLARLLPKVSCFLPVGVSSLSGLALMGGVLSAFVCLRQHDSKILVALSSVAHMSMVIAAIFSLSVWGLNGALIVMLGHGFCSSGLFFLVNTSYLRAGSRSFLGVKSSMSLAPSATLWWLLLCVVNMAAPPSLNLFGEILILISLVSQSLWFMAPGGLLCFLAAVYSLSLFFRGSHGGSSSGGSNLQLNPSEGLSAILHWIPVNLLIVATGVTSCLV